MKDIKLKFKEKLKVPLEKEVKETSNTEVGDVAECLMNSAKSLHKLHLKIKGQGSYAAHNALNGYDKFHEFADDLIEGFQGASETIVDIPSEPEKNLNTVQDAISHLQYVKDEVTELQSKLKYSEIINQLDLIKEHCNSMIYKLKFLS
jgi:Na+/phosphate symporter